MTDLTSLKVLSNRNRQGFIDKKPRKALSLEDLTPKIAALY